MALTEPIHTTADGWKLTAVVESHEKRNTRRWLAIWVTPAGSGCVHQHLPLDTFETGRDEATAYAAANPPTWPATSPKLLAARG